MRDSGNPVGLVRAPYEGRPSGSHFRTVCRLWPLLPLRKLITGQSILQEISKVVRSFAEIPLVLPRKLSEELRRS